MVSFDKSMMSSSSKMDDNINWKIIKELYINNYENINGDKQVIPKIFHQVWLGSDYPEYYKKFKESFIKHNPGWEFKIWTDDDINSLDMTNKKVFNMVDNFGFKSDIVRYEILYKYGGVYIDTDFLCLKSFDSLLNLDFFAGTGHLSDPLFFNGLIGSKKNNNFLLKVIEEIKKISISDDKNKNNFDKIINTTGPGFISKLFFNYIDMNKNSVIFPASYFYPLPAVNRYQIKNDINKLKQFLKEESYCVHLWHQSWQK